MRVEGLEFRALRIYVFTSLGVCWSQRLKVLTLGFSVWLQGTAGGFFGSFRAMGWLRRCGGFQDLGLKDFGSRI